MKRSKRLIVKIGLLAVAIVLVTSLASFAPTRVVVTGEGNLSLETSVALAVNNPPASKVTSPIRQQFGETVVVEEPWGYLYTLENGDIVEVGDSTTTDFKAHVKTIRWNGVADFSLWLGNETFVPTLTDTTVSFDLTNTVSIQIYPVLPCERLPEGGIEYDFTLSKKPAKPTVTFGIDWNGITWTKILPLDEEYDQVACEEEWGVELAPFTLTPTSITSDVTSGILKTRAEYEVNSYIGMATTNWHDSSDMGNNVFYSTVSRSYLHIHRGLMTDALNDTAWVEDINIDEQAKTVTFDLPKTWLQGATYPVHQVCGLDPAYTEDMDSWLSNAWPSAADGTWGDWDLFTEKGVPKGAVAEIIFAMQEAGVENAMGVRTDGSSLSRYLNSLHEAEGGGVQTSRMFVLCDASTGLIECYHSDVSDVDSFYVVGYWENVSFTELSSYFYADSEASWVDEVLADSACADKVTHILVLNGSGATGQNLAAIGGVRSNGSSLERKVLIHESENGGSSIIDFIVKPDSNYTIEVYADDTADVVQPFANLGYFGEELDFVELFQEINTVGAGWQTADLTSYLDQDGRVCDFLLAHDQENIEFLLGARDGDDTTTNRYILEHEAESAGAGGEYTGFGISVKSNASGLVYLYNIQTYDYAHLMGYFKPAAVGEANISNTPNSKAFGVVSNSTTYWANGSEPTWPLVDGDAYFTVTNNGDTCSITITATNFTGGVGWTLGVPAENYARITAFKEGDGSGDGVTVTTSPQAFISALSTNIDWEIKLETPTSHTDGAEKTSTITLAATLD